MTINEIIYDVREGVKKFSDDSIYSDRYIIHRINTVRNKFLNQSLNNFRGIKGSNVLQKYCTKLKEVSSSICGEFSCDTILKSEEPVPETLSILNIPSIVRIKPTNILSKKISLISLDRLEFVEGSSFNKSLYAFVDVDNYLYIFSNEGDYKNLECVEVTGIFSNPMELEDYTNCCDCENIETCFDPDIENYPVFKHMVNDIVEITTQQLLRREQIPQDTQNNSNET